MRERSPVNFRTWRENPPTPTGPRGGGHRAARDYSILLALIAISRMEEMRGGGGKGRSTHAWNVLLTRKTDARKEREGRGGKRRRRKSGSCCCVISQGEEGAGGRRDEERVRLCVSAYKRRGEATVMTGKNTHILYTYMCLAIEDVTVEWLFLL